MKKTVAPLLAGVKKLSTITDVLKAAEEVGLPVPASPDRSRGQAAGAGADDALRLLWLALVVHRAGFGLPADPLRARGWVRFGRPLEEGEEPEPGDVGVVGGAAGIITAAGHKRITLQVGPGETVSVDGDDVMTVRRPIAPKSDGGNT